LGSVRRTPEPIPAAPQGVVEGALETLDGQWRVEAIRLRNDRFFRLIHGDNAVDGLAIATVEHLLGEAGVEMADLVDVTDGLAAPAPPGAA
jgi:bifunctional non-homologous end joining protein LigD